MKNILLVAFIACFGLKASAQQNPYPYPVEQWQKIGTAALERMDYKKLRQVFIKVIPTQANGGTIDITALGFNSIISQQISAKRSNANAYDVPNVSFKSISNTSVSYTITQGNGALVSVLGFNVLSGPSTIFATDLSNIEISITLNGY